jgi:hypothetical protein
MTMSYSTLFHQAAHFHIRRSKRSYTPQRVLPKSATVHIQTKILYTNAGHQLPQSRPYATLVITIPN